MAIRVASVDDHAITSVGIGTLLKDSSESVLVAAYPTVSALLKDHQVGAVDVVLLDLRLNDGSDPYVNVQSLREAGMKVLIFSSLESPFLLRRVLRSGVSGVLRKTVNPKVLREAILCAHAGNVYATAEWAGVIDFESDFSDVQLSERQREVLELYAMGESAKRVATLTGLSVDTVQDYLQRIRTKYALQGRVSSTQTDLLQRAQEDGYLPGPLES